MGAWSNRANNEGQLGGTHTTDPQPDAIAVNMLGPPFAQVACGGAHTCARTIVSDVWCWGWNAHGELGTGEKINTFGLETTPPQVCTLCGVEGVATGSVHTCAFKRDGYLWCWGGNEKGQLGHDGPSTSIPQLVELGAP